MSSPLRVRQSRMTWGRNDIVVKVAARSPTRLMNCGETDERFDIFTVYHGFGIGCRNLP